MRVKRDGSGLEQLGPGGRCVEPAGVLREQIHQFKYGNALWLKNDLVDLLHGCLLAHFTPDSASNMAPKSLRV